MEKIKNKFSTAVVSGIIFGSLCALLDLIPANNIWTFSSFSGSLGFWAISGMIILMLYDKMWRSAVGTGLYFACMNASFFIMHYIISPLFQYPRINELSSALIQAATWTIPSALCGLCAIVAFQAKKDNFLGTAALSLPLGLLLSEAVRMFLSVIINHKYLFQLIVDILGFFLLWILYSKQKKNIWLFLFSIAVGGVIILTTYIVNKNLLFY